jgi:thioredoxin reductase (NADPH)
MPNQFHSRVLILGSGAAGCTAAIYAARANLKPVMVHGMQPGGQLTITSDVENFPGFEHAVKGPWLMEQMEKQAAHVGTQIVHDSIGKVDLSKRPFRCVGESGDLYTGDTLVIATGASARWLETPSERHYRGFGISACATCDGFFFRDREVLVIGGGNSAVEEALFLTNFASKVTLVHRRDALRAEKIGQERLFKHPKVSVIWDSVVEEFIGEEKPARALTGAKLRNVKTGAVTQVKAEGAFIAIGHVPNTAIFKDQMKLDEEGYILTTPGSTKTSVPGVFAAGDVQDKIFRQAVTAAGTGCMAALEAERFLAHHEGEESPAAY